MNIVHDTKPHNKFNYPRPVGTCLTIHAANKQKSYPWKLG
jgi:hypothetical protein